MSKFEEPLVIVRPADGNYQLLRDNRLHEFWARLCPAANAAHGVVDFRSVDAIVEVFSGGLRGLEEQGFPLDIDGWRRPALDCMLDFIEARDRISFLKYVNAATRIFGDIDRAMDFLARVIKADLHFHTKMEFISDTEFEVWRPVRLPHGEEVL